MALHKNNCNLERFSPPEIEHPVLTGEEKHLAPVGNPTPAVQPVARRDATDTGVIRIECTPLHIYFSLDSVFNCFIYACLLLTTNLFAIRVVLRERCSHGNVSSEGTPRKTPPDCYLRAAAWQLTQQNKNMVMGPDGARHQE
jgi:hypothetical protein